MRLQNPFGQGQGGQYRIVEFLKEYPNKWFSVNELSQLLFISPNSASCSARRAARHNMIKKRIIEQNKVLYCFEKKEKS